STCFSFFLTATATSAIYTLSLHDALPIYAVRPAGGRSVRRRVPRRARHEGADRVPGAGRECDALPRLPHQSPARNARFRHRGGGDWKSTRLNSSHDQISYAVFCLKKKKKK